MTLRIDREVLEYFRDGGAGYQTRINDVLRSFVMAHTPGRRWTPNHHWSARA